MEIATTTMQTSRPRGASNLHNGLAFLASQTLLKASNIKNNNTKTTKSLNSSNASSAILISSNTQSNRKTSAPANISSLCITTTNVATTSSTAVVSTSAPSTTTTATSSATPGNHNKHSFKIPSDILDDLASRFIINVPDMELSNLIRICFQIELAHWFYLDFFCASQEEKKLQPCGIKQFAMQIFQHIPFLQQHLSTIDKILEDWKNYKLSVPTYGAILISEDLNYCLLVQSYFAKSSWGFPKGKVNENEDPVHCATREVFEETGYDITQLIVSNDYIDAVINYQYTRLYIVRGVSLQTQFSPRTRNEIKCCDWFPIDSLPNNKNDVASKAKLGLNANSFFMIIPFVKRLKKWVNDKRTGVETRRKYSGGSNSPKSCSPTNVYNNSKHTGGVGGSNKKLPQSATGNNNSNRSKRQRHKSMGDLDGVKLNNLNHTNNSKQQITTTTTTATNGVETNTTNNGGNHKGKSNSKIVAAGSNQNNNNLSNSNQTSKRQLFHSQSQNANMSQYLATEKIVSSFDLIRKEKQQLKAAQAKAQKQQQQQNVDSNNSGRVRAKSQSDKLLNNNNNNNNTNNQPTTSNKQATKQRLQKQQSMIITNSNANLTPMSGTDLLALAAAAAAQNSHNKSNSSNSAGANLLQALSGPKPRPSSVSLHFPSSPTAATTLEEVERITKANNLRILKRSTSHQPAAAVALQQKQQQHQRQQQLRLQQHPQQMKFNPSFNSWTNFSFTKNFITNVFC